MCVCACVRGRGIGGEEGKEIPPRVPSHWPDSDPHRHRVALVVDRNVTVPRSSLQPDEVRDARGLARTCPVNARLPFDGVCCTLYVPVRKCSRIKYIQPPYTGSCTCLDDVVVVTERIPSPGFQQDAAQYRC